MVCVISLISARDPDGVSLRIGMIMVIIGASMWLGWQVLLPVSLAVWLFPNIGRSAVSDYELFSLNMMLEVCGLVGLAAFSALARMSLRGLEEEDLLLGLHSESMLGLDASTGVFEESQLRISIEAELARSRRFARSFSLVLIGIDEMRQRFDYRDQGAWQQSFAATASLLRGTRFNVDRVYRYGPSGFAMILPESGPKDVNGLVRRLRREGRKTRPAEGEPGGPLPAYFGATFFPTCATSTDDLLRRAEIALRIADNNASHVQLDGAEAPEMPPLETLRQPALEELVDQPFELPAVPGLHVLQTLPDPMSGMHEVDEEPPFEVYALQAPEPAVDEYAPTWVSEAPLSVVPRPRATPYLVSVPTTGEPKRDEPLDTSVNEALKRLDETLDLIRSLKQRSA
jgi:GGDEF domain-containing protein